jgi:hypothetical protein
MTMNRPPTPEYLEFLSAYDPAIVDLALATRAFVLAEAPDAAELVYDAYNAVAAGYSFTGRPSDSFIHIATYAKWVNLGFNHGALLKDPQGILQGAGKHIRHIRISSAADLERNNIRAFVRAAIEQAPRAPHTTAGKSVVRAIYPKRRRPAT